MYFFLSMVKTFDIKAIIDDLNIEIIPGRFYGIIGPNGSGKTTLLDLLISHKKPASGEIRYKDKNVGKYSKKRLSKEIALVPQNFYINFAFTAKEVVAMGRYPHIPRFGSPSIEDMRIVDEVMV